MKKKIERKFEYDKKTDSFIFTQSELSPVMIEGKEMASHNATIKQIWSNKGFMKYYQDMEKQLRNVKAGLDNTKEDLKQIGIISKDDKNRIERFRALMKKAQNLEKFEKLEAQKKSQQDMANNLEKDFKMFEGAMNEFKKS